jgi:hypothetical protein
VITGDRSKRSARSFAALQPLVGDFSEGLASGHQRHRYVGAILLAALDRHIDVIGSDLDRAGDAPGALRREYRRARSTEGVEDDLASVGVGLDDELRHDHREHRRVVEGLADGSALASCSAFWPRD